jgi:predicted TIM-barrel fold metal-dependent hydrolase
MISIDPVLPYHHPAYDRFWATAEALNLPLSLHTGTMRWKTGMDTSAVVMQSAFDFSNREHNPRECVNSMVFAGIFERYPELKVGVVEFEVAWAPYFINRMDEFYKQRPTGVQLPRFKNDMLPSDFFRNNIFIGFQEDDLGIQLRHHIGVNTLLWGSDYPHAESTFPKSREILGQILAGVPEDEQAKIAGENTAKLYGFD